MKRTCILTIVAATFCAALVSANERNFERSKTPISKQLQEILAENSIDVAKKDVMAKVLFKVNLEGKIEILEIVSERKDVTWFLNRKLKGKRLNVDNASFGEVFVVDVRVTS